ncbi:MAG: prepilin-type N-terminal cleavage/methylation domain-containing protein [Candidatus Paceibacterota bacterium]
MKSLFTLRTRKSIKGFTLVETLVSIFVITMVILGPLTVAINASSYAKETKDTMIANYLAQEALELLHHQQDSVYIRCVTSDNANCPLSVVGNGVYEIPREAAWRIFRTKLNSGVDCFAATGCSFDFMDMTTNEDAVPTKYLPTSASCSTLSKTASNLYVCSGAHGAGGIATTFTRSVFFESIPTVDAVYNDDFRATVEVSFRRSNGYTRTIRVVDFFHARS